MIGYILRRLVVLVLTLLAAALVIFLVLEVLPGDPAAVTLGLNASPEALAALHAELGLDKPAPLRFLLWLGGLASGDLGLSYTYRVPVAQLIMERMAVTLPLAVLAIALAVLIGMPLGVLAASRHGRLADAGVMAFAQAGLAIPNFWFGLLLVLVFAVGLGWLPAGGFPGWQAGLATSLKSLAMPALALALPQAAIIARVTRSAMLDTLQEDFVRTARAKGLSEGTTMRRHALRNALIPVVTLVGLQAPLLFGGAVILEQIFVIPGMGLLLLEAVGSRDYPTITGVFLVIGVAVVLINLLVDLSYGFLDPKVRNR